jgi:hypothetical protein
VANDFGCREEQTLEWLRDLRISNKEAFQELIARNPERTLRGVRVR